MSIKQLRYTYFKVMDKLVTWLEKSIYDETYQDVDIQRIALEIENEELKNRISYLTERNDY